MTNFLSAYSIQAWLESAPQGYLQNTRYGHEPGEREPDALLESEERRMQAIRFTVQLVTGERCALAASSGLINSAPDEASKRFLATQTLEDFVSVDMLRTVVESCPTKLLLANPALDHGRYAELFQLNEMELDLLTSLVPRSQFLLKRADLTKVLTLAVDPKSYWIYTNTPIDNEVVATMFQEHGFEAGLDRLAASA